MNFLSRIPLSAWYAFSVLYCYALWNPYFSAFQIMQGNVHPSVKALIAVVALIVLSLYIVEGHRTLNVMGIALFLALFGAVAWLAYDLGFRGFTSFHLWGQLVVALFMTLAVQGGRIYRVLTGRVPVATTVYNNQTGASAAALHDTPIHHSDQ